MNPTPVQESNPVPPAAPAPRPRGRRNRDVLGLVWLHGSFQAAAFRRHVMGPTWSARAPVSTIEEFAAALDEALVALNFMGTDVFLILEHEQFVHQTEFAPAFSESASRTYLRSLVQRHEAQHEPVLWVSQNTVSARKEASFLLHLLPVGFYARVNGVLRARLLDLTSILPLAVPLQLMLEKFSAPPGQPVLIAAQAGDGTAVMLGQVGSPLYFARTMQARWESDPARIAVEVNRSLLYAKQQFGVAVTRLWLLGGGLEQARTEIQNRCGADKELTVHPVGPLDWLQAVAKPSVSHPVNLVAGYITRKRRLQFLRRVIVGVCWLALALGGLESWSRALSWKGEHDRLKGLESNRETLLAERERILQRNASAEHQRTFIQQVTEGRLPLVPVKLLAFIGRSLPPEIHLTDYNVKWDSATSAWIFRFDGQITSDDETARELLSAWQRLLAKSPLRVRFNDRARVVMPVPVAGDGMAISQRFSVEGSINED